MPHSPRHLILPGKNLEGKPVWVAYDENGTRFCSDPYYEDCVIKLGLMGYNMDPIPPNSAEGERIRNILNGNL